MRILMVTNTYTPHVGGVASSIVRFENQFRARGHRVMVVAPEYEGAPAFEENVLRVPAFTHVNKSEFSLALMIPDSIVNEVERFNPHIIHSHHPYLLGVGALRMAASLNIPAVFTHHTMYEHYMHYVASESDAMKRFIISLSAGYANLCDQIIAPSKLVRKVLKMRGVTTPMTVLPSGVDVRRFRHGDRPGARARYGIPADAPVIGHVGRLAKEKNLPFLTAAVAEYLTKDAKAHFLVVGQGPASDAIRSECEARGVAARLHMAGNLDGDDLVDAYHAADIFAFASKSETQGMVLAEAMAAGLPVVALDAPPINEIVRNGYNGRLVALESVDEFAAALDSAFSMKGAARQRMLRNARATAHDFSELRTASQALRLYRTVIRRKSKTVAATVEQGREWGQFVRSIEEDWKVWGVRLTALFEAIGLARPTGRVPPSEVSSNRGTL